MIWSPIQDVKLTLFKNLSRLFQKCHGWQYVCFNFIGRAYRCFSHLIWLSCLFSRIISLFPLQKSVFLQYCFNKCGQFWCGVAILLSKARIFKVFISSSTCFTVTQVLLFCPETKTNVSGQERVNHTERLMQNSLFPSVVWTDGTPGLHHHTQQCVSVQTQLPHLFPCRLIKSFTFTKNKIKKKHSSVVFYIIDELTRTRVLIYEHDISLVINVTSRVTSVPKALHEPAVLNMPSWWHKTKRWTSRHTQHLDDTGFMTSELLILMSGKHNHGPCSQGAFQLLDASRSTSSKDGMRNVNSNGSAWVFVRVWTWGVKKVTSIFQCAITHRA